MARLEYSYHIGLDQVFQDNEKMINNCVLNTIYQNYFKPEIQSVIIITVRICSIDYKIELSKSKFLTALKNIIIFFEKTEEYEKCALANEIINRIHQIDNLYKTIH